MGLLTGKYPQDGTLDQQDHRRKLYPFHEPYFTLYCRMLILMAEIAQRHGESPAPIALAWAMGQQLETILIGARTKEQLTRNLHAGTVRLETAESAQLTQLAMEIDQAIPICEDNPFFHRW